MLDLFKLLEVLEEEFPKWEISISKDSREGDFILRFHLIDKSKKQKKELDVVLLKSEITKSKLNPIDFISHILSHYIEKYTE